MGWSYKSCCKTHKRLCTGCLKGLKKVVGMSSIGYVMVAGRFQKGCGKATDKLCNVCWKVANRLRFWL